jgi:hypothetical protein
MEADAERPRGSSARYAHFQTEITNQTLGKS